MSGESHSMPPDDLYAEMRGIVAEVGRRLGVRVDDAELLRLHSNALFALPSAGLVVRVATNPRAGPRVAGSIAVTRWLAERGFACTTPATDHQQPLLVEGRTVSLWHYLPTVAQPPVSGAELGSLLRSLHEQPLPPQPPARLRDPLASVAEAIEGHPEALAEPERSWLSGRVTELRQQWTGLWFAHEPCLVHGDAHTNNLMRTAAGKVVLGDWDHVALGPREWDLIQVHYTHRRFARPAAAEIDAYTRAYGWDVARWPGFAVLVSIREISGLSAYIRTAATKPFSREELAHRVRTLRDGETTARWTPPGTPSRARP